VAAALIAAALLPALAPLQPLVETCWAAHHHGGVKIRHCFETLDHGRQVRDRVVVTSGPTAVYEGETLYRAEGGQLVFTYRNKQGGEGRGTASFRDGLMTFRMRMRPTATGEPADREDVWRITSGGFESVSATGAVSFQPDGKP
jgi:hypothetical protein